MAAPVRLWLHAKSVNYIAVAGKLNMMAKRTRRILTLATPSDDVDLVDQFPLNRILAHVPRRRLKIFLLHGGDVLEDDERPTCLRIH